MQPVPDPYRALGVPRGATEADIKAAHRRLAKRYHPDAAGGDADRFLKVQEAYRVLSDPLLRREWDASHAGPVRADRPAATAPRPRRPRPPRRPAAQAAPSSDASPGDEAADADRPPAAETGPGRPRSARAYTWTATEVPWWEEGTAAQKARRRRAARPEGEGTPATEGEQVDAPNEFDVYNRSSGAAWSMAARAYFRRGEQDLPRRGSFRHQGAQPLTAARARAAAEVEARERAAASQDEAAARPSEARAPRGQTPPPSAPYPSGQAPMAAQPAFAYASAGVARDPMRVARVRADYLRRTRALGWPSLRQRLLLALAAWVPLALLIGYGAFQTAGCGTTLAGCPQEVELGVFGFLGLLLVVLIAVPKVAYAGTIGMLGLLLAGAVAVGVLAALRIPLPLATPTLTLLVAVMAVGYFASAVLVAARGGPWR